MKNSLLRIVIFSAMLAGSLYSLAAFGQEPAVKLEIHHLTGDFYVYTTYHPVDGKPFPSNSMYLVTTRGVVLFDTPWDSTCFQPLLDSIRIKHHKEVVMCISTHFHDDRTAGLSFFASKGIKTFTSAMTDSLSANEHHARAKYLFTGDTSFCAGKYCFNTYYPGEGHTKDNLVIWFEKERILYAGCLVKSVDNNSLGNIADANLQEWPKTIENLIAKFHRPAYVIPGHFSWTDNKSLEHTLMLLKNQHS